MPGQKTMLNKARMYLMRYAPEGREPVETKMIARSPYRVKRAATNLFDYNTREPVKMKDVEVLGEVYGPYTKEQQKLMERLSGKWAPAADLHEWEVRFDDGSYTYVDAFNQQEVLETLYRRGIRGRVVSILRTTDLL